MNTAAKGRRNEHRSRRLLEAAGYDVIRAAASKGVWDLVGIGEDDVVLVQCKSNEWPRSDEMERLRAFRAPPLCRKIIHRWRDRRGKPDVRVV